MIGRPSNIYVHTDIGLVTLWSRDIGYARCGHQYVSGHKDVFPVTSFFSFFFLNNSVFFFDYPKSHHEHLYLKSSYSLVVCGFDSKIQAFF